MDQRSADFYDAFVGYQQDTGINDRIASLYGRMRRLGLHARSNVLELGCGIGALTLLIARTVTRGAVEAVDLSPASVEAARRALAGTPVRFATGDAVTYRPASAGWDFITLFDIIEHIPEERHEALFRNVAGCMGDATLLLINVPGPETIEYDRRHHPERLQAVDQPVRPAALAARLEAAGLRLVRYEAYGIWMKDDYAFYAAEKQRPFSEVPVLAGNRLWQRAMRWLRRRRLRHIGRRLKG